MGSAASALGAAQPGDLQALGAELSEEQRAKLKEALARVEEEDPLPGEEVLLEVEGTSNYWRSSDLLDLDGKTWRAAVFWGIKDGAYTVNHGHHAVARHKLRRYPQGMRPPKLAGVTLEQLQKIFEENREWLGTAMWNPHMQKMMTPSMYDVVPTIVKPATASTRGSYAELFSQKPVDVFVSHWWGHEFSEFLAALEHAADELVKEVPTLAGRDPKSVVFWICSFANAQWKVNLGQSLQESPFERALAAHSCKAVVMVLDEKAMPLTRIWCIYEVLRTSVLELPFFCAAKDGVLLGERVRESPALAKTLVALAERVSTLEPSAALASNEEDRQAIIGAVADAVGVPQFALAVQSSLFEVLRKAGYALFSRNWRLNFRMLNLHRAASREVYWLVPARKRPNWRRRDERKRNRLHRAAQEGDLERIQLLLREGQTQHEDLEIAKEEQRALQTKQIPDLHERFRLRDEMKAKVDQLTAELLDGPDQLGQKALHLAARWGTRDAFELLAEMRRGDLRERDRLGRLPLHRAAEAGDGALLQSVIAFYETDELQALDKNQHSALDLAVLSGAVEAVRAIASSCAQPAPGKRSPVHLAAQWNHAELLEELGHVFAVDGGDLQETRPLHLAARFGHSEAVSVLLGLRADAAKATSFGRTPLHWAALNGHSGVAEQLMDAGCPAEARDNSGWTAFHWTLRRCHAECSRKLMRRDADLPGDLKNGRGCLHVAACFDVETTLIEDLAAPPSSLSATDVRGKTPLHLAAQWGRIGVVAKLLELQSDLGLCCSHGRTALYLAAQRGNRGAAELLLAAKADAMLADLNGVAPVFAAARRGHFETVFTILEHEVDVSLAEKDGMTLLHWAAKHNNSQAAFRLAALAPSLVSATTRHGRTALHAACAAPSEQAALELLRLRCDANLPQKDGWQPIHLAARFGRQQLVLSLAEYSCDLQAVAKVQGRRPVHLLAQWNRLETFRTEGLDFFARDGLGRTAWHAAALRGHTRIFHDRYLMRGRSKDGQMNILSQCTVDAQQRTALHLAAKKGFHELVRDILNNFLGDDEAFNARWHMPSSKQPAPDEEPPPPVPLLMKDADGRLPLHLAARNGFAQVTSILAKFMLEKLECSEEQLQEPDHQQQSPLQLALQKGHKDVARRLVDVLGTSVPERLKELEAKEALVAASLGTQVVVKENFTTESGEHLEKGLQGSLLGYGAEVTVQFEGRAPTVLTVCELARCAVEKSYLLNGCAWRRRAKQDYPSICKFSEPMSCTPLAREGAGDFKEGDVVRGFEENGWLRMADGFLPFALQARSRAVPALTPWSGPSLSRGQLLRTRDAGKLRGRVPAGALGVVCRVEETDRALVKFQGGRQMLAGAEFGELEVLPYVTLLEEPRDIPPDGLVVLDSKKGAHAARCGKVRQGEDGRNGARFQVIFPDGSSSPLLAERMGLRNISCPPSLQELEEYLQAVSRNCQ